MESTKKFPREYGHGRANYINGPRVAGARSLPAKSDQVISGVVFSSRAAGTRAPGPGLFKHRAASFERRASSFELSYERQATSSERRATSD